MFRFVTGLGTYDVFCGDGTGLFAPGPYHLASPTSVYSPLMVSRLVALMENMSPVGGAIASAAEQVAIWQLIAGGVVTIAPYGGNNADVTAVWAQAMTAYNNVVGNIWTASGANTLALLVPNNGVGGQPMLGLIPGSPPSLDIPEPASMALLGTGLLGLGLARRRWTI